MNWLTNTLGTSIGKKLMMAVTGLSFIGFLTLHLAGNLSIYGGPGMFNAYAEHLHALGPVLVVAEWILLALALVHILTGMFLFVQNLAARPRRYRVNKNGGGRTIGSATMPYTGILILLFVVFHLANFSFVDKSGTTIFDIVSHAFADPVTVGIYILSMVVVAFHVSHGFWSLFQTLGLNHPKYMPAIMIAGTVISLVFGIGFGFLPIYFSFFA
jgi:succinate dehydrogenase / fumarate reductase cytochrome b subunit